MDEIRTAKPMVILRNKGRGVFSGKLNLRASAYHTVRTCTILSIKEVKTD